MAEYTVRLEHGRTGVNARQTGPSAACTLWICWYGEVTTHRWGERTATITSRWHFTIIRRHRIRAPAAAMVQTLTEMGNRTIRTLGELSIVGPPFGRPRQEGHNYPALYGVNAATSAHGQLSTLMYHMERILRMDHVHRINFHLSIDEPPEDSSEDSSEDVWEFVD